MVDALNNKTHFGRILILVLGFISCNSSYAQQHEIDSLKRVLANNQKADTNRVIALNGLAFNYYTTNLDDLKVYGNQALALSYQLKYKKGEAVAYKNLGLGYLAANANPLALDYFDKSLKIFRALNDRGNSGRVLNNIGYYYGTIKDHQQEQKYFLQAIDEIKGLNEHRVMAVILGNIGNSYEAVNQLNVARNFYMQALKISLDHNLQGDVATSYANLASIELKEKKYDKAIAYCNKVLVIKSHSDNFKPRTLAAVYSLLDKIYFQQKNYSKARQALIESWVIANKIGNAERIKSNYYDFYLLDSVKGDYRSALNNYYQYSRLNDSLTNVNKNSVVALYQVKFDSQKRSDENRRLRSEEEKNQAIISQQTKIQYLLLIGLIIICGGVVYLKYIYDQVKSKNKIINQQNQVLESNNLVKDKLFSVISHDLRSPITQVIGLLNLMDAGELTLDNLLIWSKDQLQGFQLNLELFNLNQLTAESILALNGIIQQKQLLVENNILPDVTVNADREMIQIILRNLVSNAVKFTNPKGSIRISSRIEGGNINICVTDTGIGIKETDLDKIFSFTSHTTLGTDNEKGTGIGLKICKDFIELNNGRIWVESKEGLGSMFCISLPL
jgi:signal transduction histidine kinase/Tfp pilus assembly protein PilF